MSSTVGWDGWFVKLQGHIHIHSHSHTDRVWLRWRFFFWIPLFRFHLSHYQLLTPLTQIITKQPTQRQHQQHKFVCAVVCTLEATRSTPSRSVPFRKSNEVTKLYNRGLQQCAAEREREREREHCHTVVCICHKQTHTHTNYTINLTKSSFKQSLSWHQIQTKEGSYLGSARRTKVRWTTRGSRSFRF